MSLEGKISVVTGGTQGLGLEIAKEFARNGATVIITSRKKSKLGKACSAIDGNCYGFELDISKSKSVVKFIKNILKIGTVDILINNAGFPFKRKIWFKNIHDISEIELIKILQVDLIGSFRVTKEVLRLMIKNKNGVIINLSSTPSISGYVCGSPYSIAKAGLVCLTKHIALEYGQYNIRSYSVALGNISTDATYRRLSKSEITQAKNENTLKRWGRPKEVAKSIVCLAGDNFSFSTGNTIIIDGGKVII